MKIIKKTHLLKKTPCISEPMSFKSVLFEGQPYIQRLGQYEEHYVVPVNTNSTDTVYCVNKYYRNVIS